MGISSLFDPATSDLSGLVKTSSSSSKDRPVVSRMVHSTLLDINEFGATGAAATILSGYPISVASSLDIDKPFLFLLNDRLTGPVLIGQMTNPLK
jgi:serpin B